MGRPQEGPDSYDVLMRELPKIAKAVNAFASESVQKDAFQQLVRALLSAPTGPHAPSPRPASQPAAKPAKKRRAPAAAKRPARTSGTSARARVEVLAGEDFFSQPRKVADATQALRERGHHYTPRRLSMALLTLVRHKKLRRQGSPGKYEYVNP
jgi:hypothetical protein